MSYNHFQIRNLVRRSDAPVYKNQFVLTTDVNRLAQLDDFKKVMQLAADSSPDAWYLHFHTRAREPRDTVRIVPSALNAFNSSRVLRRSRVSGLRMCNLYQKQSGAYYYVSDMVVSCSFDAIAIASTLADYCKLANRVYVSFDYPKSCRQNPKKADYRAYAEQLIREFWSRSMLARHSVFVSPEPHDVLSFYVTLVFEPKSMELWPLLEYIFRSLGDKLSHLSINNNETLIISRTSQVEDDLYFAYKPTDVFARVRYRRFSAFGTFYNNPNYLF